MVAAVAIAHDFAVDQADLRRVNEHLAAKVIVVRLWRSLSEFMLVPNHLPCSRKRMMSSGRGSGRTRR